MQMLLTVVPEGDRANVRVSERDRDRLSRIRKDFGMPAHQSIRIALDLLEAHLKQKGAIAS